MESSLGHRLAREGAKAIASIDVSFVKELALKVLFWICHVYWRNPKLLIARFKVVGNAEAFNCLLGEDSIESKLVFPLIKIILKLKDSLLEIWIIIFRN